MKVTNMSNKSITLKRNSKLADMSTYLIVEDFEVFQGTSQPEKDKHNKKHNHPKSTDLKQ